MSAVLLKDTETDATLIRELDEHELDHVRGGGANGGMSGGDGGAGNMNSSGGGPGSNPALFSVKLGSTSIEG